MSLLKQPDDEARRLSRALRLGDGEHLRRRRRVAGLSLAAIGSMGVIAAYQIGLLKRLPDVPLPYFDAERVDAAPQAYRYLKTPDAVLGLGSYAVTLALAAYGGPDRARTAPLVPVALAAKAAVDAANAAKLSVDQWTQHRAFCVWCLAAAGATFAALPLTLPEAGAAARRLLGRG
jgi:hypothetical protein